MKEIAQAWFTLTIVSTWLAGIALAQGFVSVVAAVLFPPWAWYLFVEKCLMVAGWL